MVLNYTHTGLPTTNETLYTNQASKSSYFKSFFLFTVSSFVGNPVYPRKVSKTFFEVLPGKKYLKF